MKRGFTLNQVVHDGELEDGSQMPNSMMGCSEEFEDFDQFGVGGSGSDEPEESSQDEELDLHEYFNSFSVPMPDRVKLCRAYARFASATDSAKKSFIQ